MFKPALKQNFGVINSQQETEEKSNAETCLKSELKRVTGWLQLHDHTADWWQELYFNSTSNLTNKYNLIVFLLLICDSSVKNLR